MRSVDVHGWYASVLWMLSLGHWQLVLLFFSDGYMHGLVEDPARPLHQVPVGLHREMGGEIALGANLLVLLIVLGASLHASGGGLFLEPAWWHGGRTHARHTRARRGAPWWYLWYLESCRWDNR